MTILNAIGQLARTKGLQNLSLTELAVLYGSTIPMAPVEYLVLLNCPRPKLTRAFIALEKAGYVKREVNRADRRGVVIRSTPKGEAVVAKTLQLL